METTKTTSARYLLQQVQSRFNINNSNWRANALDFIGLIVEEIGYHTGFEETEIQIEVENYRAKVPGAVIAIDGINKGGFPLASISRRDAMNRRNGLPTLQVANYEHVLALNKQTDRLEELKQMYLENPSDDLLFAIKDTRDKIRQLIEGITYQNHSGSLRCDWYLIEKGYIRTSFESGCITVGVSRFMVDEHGIPEVVDTFKYREACIWGILYYIMIGGYIHPTISLGYAEGQKDFFIGQARNEPKMMNMDRHQAFTENWSSVCRGVENETLNLL